LEPDLERLQEKEKLKSIKNLHSTVCETAVVIVRGITEVLVHTSGTSLSFLTVTRREESTRKDMMSFSCILGHDSILEHHGTG
jgi:hypothetical protein